MTSCRRPEPDTRLRARAACGQGFNETPIAAFHQLSGHTAGSMPADVDIQRTPLAVREWRERRGPRKAPLGKGSESMTWSSQGRRTLVAPSAMLSIAGALIYAGIVAAPAMAVGSPAPG